MTNDFQHENFSIIISWETVGYVDEYRIDINTTTQSINCCLKCYLSCMMFTHYYLSLSLSAGCSPPTPPVNGSIDDWISSMVGVQVTYSCDRDLVIVGETVATCSPSLQWIPSSNDIMCEQPPPGMYSHYTSHVVLANIFTQTFLLL